MYKEINLPQSIKLGVESKSKVVRLKPFQNIVSFKMLLDKSIKFYSKNTKQLYFYLSDFTLLKTIDNLKYRNLNIIFDINEKNIMLLKDLQDLVPKFRLTALLDSAVKPEEIVKVVQFLAKLNIKSQISFDLYKNIDEKLHKEITKQIVLDKDVLKMVEPFYSFANYIYSKRVKKPISETMWDSFKERLDEYLFIAEDGYATISKRWDKRSRYLFNIDESDSKRYDSELYKELDSYEQNLFFKNLECAMCESYEFCSAYLKYEDGGFNCTPFQTMLKEIDDNFDIFKLKKVA